MPAAARHSPSKMDVAAGRSNHERQPKPGQFTRMMDGKASSHFSFNNNAPILRPGGRRPASASNASRDNLRSLLHPGTFVLPERAAVEQGAKPMRCADHFTIREGVAMMRSSGGRKHGYGQRPQSVVELRAQNNAEGIGGGRRHYRADRPPHTAGGNLHAPHVLPASASPWCALGTHVGRLLRDAPPMAGARERGAKVIVPADYRLEAQSRPRGDPNPN